MSELRDLIEAERYAVKLCTDDDFGECNDAVWRARDAVDAALDEYEQPQQLTLEMPAPRARRRDPATSHDAAQLAVPRATSLCAQILDEMQEHADGQTADELAARWEMHNVDTSRRCSDLVLAGWLEATGEQRPTRSGATARVLRLTAHARAYFDGR